MVREAAAFEPEMPPGIRGPLSAPHFLLGCEEGAVAGVGSLEQPGRIVVLDDATTFDHEDAVEVGGLGDIVRDAEKRRLGPEAARPLQELAPLAPIETAERLIQDDEPRRGSHERAREANALALAARHQRPALAQLRLKSIRQTLEHLAQVGGLDHVDERRSSWSRSAEQHVLEQRSVPQAD